MVIMKNAINNSAAQLFRIKNLLYKSLMVLLIVIIAFVGVQPKKADAFFQFAAIGAVEVGALAFWGGAVLVASVGAAVGLDPDVADDIANFGKKAWTGANDGIKKSIEWSTSLMRLNDTKTYAVQFTPEVTSYLKTTWNQYFRAEPSRPQMAINPVTNKIVQAATLAKYGQMDVSVPANYLAFINTNKIGSVDARWVKRLSYIGNNKFKMFNTTNFNQNIEIYGTKNFEITIPNVTDVATAYKYLFDNNYFLTETAAGFEVNPVFINPTLPDVISPALPANIPDVFTMPAPQGTINPAGDVVTLGYPTIGYPGAVIPANPFDVAIGYPAIPGSIADLPIGQTITANPDVAIPNVSNPSIPTFPDLSNPSGDWPSKLKVAVTTRFPFSLPWDMAYLVNMFVAPPQVPVIDVHAGPIKFKVTLNQIDPYMPFIRAFLVAGFLFGLIFKTRSLLGGGK